MDQRRPQMSNRRFYLLGSCVVLLTIGVPVAGIYSQSKQKAKNPTTTFAMEPLHLQLRVDANDHAGIYTVTGCEVERVVEAFNTVGWKAEEGDMQSFKVAGDIPRFNYTAEGTLVFRELTVWHDGRVEIRWKEGRNTPENLEDMKTLAASLRRML